MGVFEQYIVEWSEAHTLSQQVGFLVSVESD